MKEKLDYPLTGPLVGQSGRQGRGGLVGGLRIPVWTAMRSEGTGGVWGLRLSLRSGLG